MSTSNPVTCPTGDAGSAQRAVANPPRARRARRTTFAAVTGVLTLGVLELATRGALGWARDPSLLMTVRDYTLVAHGATKGFGPAPYVNFGLVPGYRQTTGTGVTTHGPHGFRSQRVPASPKPEGTYRIVCLGGSTTYGAGLADDTEAYPARLEAQLDPSAFGAARSEVVNMGVGGYTSAEVFAALHFRALPLDPDVVLIKCGVNDVRPRLYDRVEPDYSHFRTTWRHVEPGPVERIAWRSRLFLVTAWLVGAIEPLTLQSRTERPLPPDHEAANNLARHPPEVFQRNLDACITLAQAAGATVFLLTEPYLKTPEEPPLERAYRIGIEQHNAVVRRLAASRGVGLVDLATQLPRERRLFLDQVHLSAEGATTEADFVARGILSAR